MANVINETPFYVLLEGISWKTYDALTDALATHKTRHTYDSGRLELRRLIPGVSWSTYMNVLDAFGQLSIRHTYLDGDLEFMSPLKDHEWIKTLLGRLIETMAWQLNLPIQSVGSMTIYRHKKEGGLQPDEAYYVKSERAVRGKKKYDPEVDPPPDLTVEIDVTNSSLERLDVYARIGVSEVWRHDGKEIHFLGLAKNNQYEPMSQSQAFPFLTVNDIQPFLNMSEDESVEENEIIHRFVAHAQAKFNDYHK